MLTILPRRLDIMRRAKAFEQRNVPLRLMSTTRSHSASSRSTTGIHVMTPAPFTRTSTPPNSSITWRAARVTSAATRTSPARKRAPPARSAGGGFTSRQTTRLPSSAKRWPICWPMAPLPPVTTTTRSARSMSMRRLPPSPRAHARRVAAGRAVRPELLRIDDHVEHDRPARAERPLQRRADLVGADDAPGRHAEAFGDAHRVHGRVEELRRRVDASPTRLAAPIVEEGLDRHVALVVEHEEDRGHPIPRGRPEGLGAAHEPAVPHAAHHGPAGLAELYPDGGARR